MLIMQSSYHLKYHRILVYHRRILTVEYDSVRRSVYISGILARHRVDDICNYVASYNLISRLDKLLEEAGGMLGPYAEQILLVHDGGNISRMAVVSYNAHTCQKSEHR